MRTIAQASTAAEANRIWNGLLQWLQVELFVVAQGYDWTDGKEPVFCPARGVGVLDTGRVWITVYLDGSEARIKPCGPDARILFIIDC